MAAVVAAGQAREVMGEVGSGWGGRLRAGMENEPGSLLN